MPEGSTMRHRILTLNNISARGLERLPRERYEISSTLEQPDAILLRSADMHGMAIPDSVRAVGRAGAGVERAHLVPLEAACADVVEGENSMPHGAPFRHDAAGSPA